jgi:hypothetical protein
VNEREYIRVLKILYDGANDYTIKVWSKEPSYSNIQRHIRLVKSYGYDEVYYTCRFSEKDNLNNLLSNNNIIIFDQEDAIKKCIEINRLDLLKIIEKGI